MASQSELALQLRSRMGDPTDEQLPDSQIELALDAAVRAFSEQRPGFTWYQFTSVIGQGVYPIPNNIIDVTEIWGTPGSVEVGDLFDPALLLLLRSPLLDAMNVQDELARRGFRPSDITIWDWHVSTADSTLTVWPIPETEIYWIIKGSTAVDYPDLAPQDIERLFLYAMAICLEYMAFRRNRPVTRIPTAVGSIHLDNGALYLETATRFREQFYAQLGKGATTVVMG